MPHAAPRPCPRPGCGRLVPYGEACPVHPVAPGRFADRRRGSRQDRGYGAAWDRLREVILRRDAGLCQVCLSMQPERVTPAVAVDHIVGKAEARRRGWSAQQVDAESNLQAICEACHTAKTAREAAASRRG